MGNYRPKWSVSIYRGNSPFELKPQPPLFTPELINDIPCKTVADPFLLCRENRWFLFFEVWNSSVGRGEIAYAQSDDATNWSYQGVILREDFHLSYPHVFEWNGTVYMVPETRQANSIRLYAAVCFPHDWRLVNVLVEGDYADSTVFFHEGKWRMFSQRGLDEMRLFQSESLEKGWEEHPASPVWSGNRTYSRPGGRILAFDGNLYRFAQDGWPGYGNNLRAMQIRCLSDLKFQETEIESSPILKASYSGWNALGMHHLDACEIAPGQWIGAVDGVTVSV